MVSASSREQDQHLMWIRFYFLIYFFRMKILVATQIFYLISTYMLRNETIFPLLMLGVPVYSQFLELCRHLAIVLLQIQFVTKPEFFYKNQALFDEVMQKLQCLVFFWFTVYMYIYIYMYMYTYMQIYCAAAKW